MSRFFCDTNSEVDINIFRSLYMELIKMPYTLNGREYYYDLGENTDLVAFFNAMRKGASVKTQALNTYDYVEYFEPVLKAGEDIIYVSFSHKMSGTFESLFKAIEELKLKYPERKITVADTKQISQGAGIIVEMAARLHAAGKSDEDILKMVEEFRQRTATYFTVDDLEYLRRGGRLSKFKSILGTLLGMKPIITIKDNGALENTETAKGRKGALKRLAAFLDEDGIDLDHPIIIIDADCRADSDLLAEMILEKCPSAVIRRQTVGPVIGCHCGPGTVGIIFIKKEQSRQA